MSLADYTPETDTVEIRRPKNGEPAQVLTLRGLNLTDFGALIADHLAEIEAIYNTYVKDRARLIRQGSLDTFLISLCTNSPEIVAEVISRGAGEPEMKEKAAQLPFSVQAVALSKIARMTFEEAGGLPNLLAALLNLLTESLGVNAAGVEPLTNLQKSLTSIGDAVETPHS